MVIGADHPDAVRSANLSVEVDWPLCSIQLRITPRSDVVSCGRLLLAFTGPVAGVTVTVHDGGAAAGVLLAPLPGSLPPHAAVTIVAAMNRAVE